MNEKVKQAQETLLKLSGLALKYLVNNFNYENEEYLKLKQEIGNLTDKLRLTLNDFDRYHESQQDLIKGKDEYIAKLCNDRAELKHENEELKKQVEQLDNLCNETMQNRDYMVAISVEDLKECQNANKKLLEENHKLKQKPQFPNINFWDNQELNDLREFAKIMSVHVLLNRFTDNSVMFYDILKKDSQAEFNLVKKVVEKYGK